MYLHAKYEFSTSKHLKVKARTDILKQRISVTAVMYDKNSGIQIFILLNLQNCKNFSTTATASETEEVFDETIEIVG